MRAFRSASFPGLVVLLALVLIAPAHAAPGVNLTWSRCHGEGVGTQNRAFACDTNDGSEVLVASFVLPADLAQVSGNEVSIDLISQDDPLPAWWDFENAGTCRMTSLTVNATADANNVVCVDWAAGGSTGGLASYSTGTPPSMGNIDPALANRHRRLSLAFAVPPDALASLLADTEYFSCNIAIDHAKTVGAGACGGCAGSVCLVIQMLNVTTPVLGNNMFLSGGTTPGSNMATWQGSGADCNLVPVRNRSWGEVKALYR
jgi:hypothetical protein